MKLLASISCFVAATTMIVACGDGGKNRRGAMKPRTKATKNEKIDPEAKDYVGSWLAESTYKELTKTKEVQSCEIFDAVNIEPDPKDRTLKVPSIVYSFITVVKDGTVYSHENSLSDEQEIGKIKNLKKKFKVVTSGNKNDQSKSLEVTEDDNSKSNFILMSEEEAKLLQDSVTACAEVKKKEIREQIVVVDQDKVELGITCSLSFAEQDQEIDMILAQDSNLGGGVKGQPFLLVNHDDGEIKTEALALNIDKNKDGKMDQGDVDEIEKSLVAYGADESSYPKLDFMEDFYKGLSVTFGDAVNENSLLTVFVENLGSDKFKLSVCSDLKCEGSKVISSVDFAKGDSTNLDQEFDKFKATNLDTEDNEVDDIKVDLDCENK